MSTLADRLSATKGRGPNFDVLRLGAALAVLVSHSFPLTTGGDAHEPIYIFSQGAATLGSLAVALFFATSGFLVTASAERTSDIADFAWRRSIRIMPALILVCVMSAFVLGPMLTTSSDYFSQSGPYRYLLNIFFVTQYELPGVFSGNPHAGTVNGSLWTLTFEVACYAALACGAKLGLLRRPILLASLLLVIVVAQVLDALDRAGTLKTFCRLASYFLAGGALYLYRQWIPLSAGAALGAAAGTLLALRFGGLEVIAPLALAYVAIWVGLQNAAADLKGDYSYGVYVWAFPVQQTLVALMPGQSWWLNVSLSVAPVMALAIASWFLIEKPALKLKRLARA